MALRVAEMSADYEDAARSKILESLERFTLDELRKRFSGLYVLVLRLGDSDNSPFVVLGYGHEPGNVQQATEASFFTGRREWLAELYVDPAFDRPAQGAPNATEVRTGRQSAILSDYGTPEGTNEGSRRNVA